MFIYSIWLYGSKGVEGTPFDNPPENPQPNYSRYRRVRTVLCFCCVNNCNVRCIWSDQGYIKSYFLTTSKPFLPSGVHKPQAIHLFLKYKNVKLLVIVSVIGHKKQVIIGYQYPLKHPYLCIPVKICGNPEHIAEQRLCRMTTFFCQLSNVTFFKHISLHKYWKKILASQIMFFKHRARHP